MRDSHFDVIARVLGANATRRRLLGLLATAAGLSAVDAAGAGAQVTNNHAEAWGGGIFNEGGKLTVGAGSAVTGNAAGYSGGGVYADGGSSDITAGTVTNNNPDNCYGSLKADCTG